MPRLFAVRLTQFQDSALWIIVEDLDRTRNSFKVTAGDLTKGARHVLWDEFAYLVTPGTYFQVSYDGQTTGANVAHPTYGDQVRFEAVRGGNRASFSGADAFRVSAFFEGFELKEVKKETHDGMTEVIYEPLFPSCFVAHLVYRMNRLPRDEAGLRTYDPSKLLISFQGTNQPALERDSLLMDRVERLMTIPAVGPITALTWALEVGDAQRFSSIKKAISYCGLCGAEKSSGNTVQRTPLSKQRNKHLQATLIEAAKMAPRYSPDLAMLYDREKQKGHANRATLAVARKLVAYLMAVDRGQRNFQVATTSRLHRCVERGGEQGGFLRRVACQVLPLIRLGEGAQALDAPVD